MGKTIIVGGVAGGMSAATRLRRLKEEEEIIIFEKGPFVSFANCGLPYYVSGEISQRDSLMVQTPASLAARFNLDVRPNHEVLSIDSEEQVVTVRHGAEVFTESYDHLILSPGARAIVPDLKGYTEAENVYTLRNVPDLDRIMKHLNKQEKMQTTVVGAGFIGLEMAENLHQAGHQVTLIEKAPHVLPPLDEEMAVVIKNELIKNGIKVLTNQGVAEFKEKGQLLILDDGSLIQSELTILAIGVQPETSLAATAKIKLGFRGGIIVDEYYQTSQRNIYAVGDAIVVKQQITGHDALISLASPANRQGRQVADNLAGLKRKNKGSLGTAIVRVFNQTAASTGLSERAARQAGLDIQVVHVRGKDHAGYYPGATELCLKLIFNPTTGEIYGAQGVGPKGVDKRIDSLATAIKGSLTVFDLPELEFTYAPPFGSAKDPVNLLGYAALNLIEGISESIQWHQLKNELAQGKILLDVRNTEELAAGSFKNSLNIPLNDLRCRLAELDLQQEYIVSCASGLRSYLAERILKQAGFKVKNLDGAFQLYQSVCPEEIEYV